MRWDEAAIAPSSCRTRSPCRQATRAIDDFVAHGGALIADTAPGLFDEHGRKLDRPRLAALFRANGASAATRARYVSLGTAGGDGAADPGAATRLGDALKGLGIEPRIRMSDKDGAPPLDVAMHVLRDGKVTILALQRDFSAAATAQPEAVTLQLPRSAYAYDVRGAKFLGRHRKLQLDLEAPSPTILALSPTPLPRPVVALPRVAHPGERLDLRLGPGGPSRAASHVLHIVVIDPVGRAVSPYSKTILTGRDGGTDRIYLPQSAPVGRWTVRVTDMLSGKSDAPTFDVTERAGTR